MERGRRGFGLDLFKPWILARRLINVPMHTRKAFGHRMPPIRAFTDRPGAMRCATCRNPLSLDPSRDSPSSDDNPGRVNVIALAFIPLTVEACAFARFDDVKAIDDGPPQP